MATTKNPAPREIMAKSLGSYYFAGHDLDGHSLHVIAAAEPEYYRVAIVYPHGEGQFSTDYTPLLTEIEAKEYMQSEIKRMS